MNTSPSEIVVRSDVAPDGSYVVSIEVGPDEAWILDREQIRAHGVAVVEAAARAEYDASVVRQLSSLGVGMDAVASVLMDLRGERRPLDDAATAPLQLVPGVSNRDGRGFLALRLHGRQIGQWELDHARHHALARFEVQAAVDLDAIYRTTLVGIIGLDDATARSVVGNLAEHGRSVAAVNDTQGWITAISVAVVAGVQLLRFLLARR